MENHNTTWSKKEFKTYLMLLCANADFIESEDEKDIIKSKVNPDILKHIHKEFDADNDYQRLQKIINTSKRFGYSKDKADELLSKLKNLFFKDHNMGILEENMFRALKRLLS